MPPILRTFRLRQERDFFVQAKRIETPDIRWFIKKIQSPTIQAIVIIPKNVETLATHRNRLKRVLKSNISKQPFSSSGLAIVALLKRKSSKIQSSLYENTKLFFDQLHSMVSEE